MAYLFDPFTPIDYPDLFTLMWVGGLLILVGSILVYNTAQIRYRRYPALLAVHEWVFWSIAITWGIVPLLVVIHVPLALLLLVTLPGMAIAVYARFFKFPPIIAAANSEIRRRRFVPPPRRDEARRPRPTPTGGHRAHRRR
jgi:hypothetical protein